MTDNILEIINSTASKLNIQALDYQMLKMGAKRIGNDCIYIDSLNNELYIQTFTNCDMGEIQNALIESLEKIGCRLKIEKKIKSNHIIFKILY